MYRFVKVISADHALVPHPSSLTSSTPRFVGRRAKMHPPDVDPDAPPSLLDFSEPVEEVVRVTPKRDERDWSHQVESAIRNGELFCLGRCTAKNHDEAAKAMTAVPRRGGKRGDE